MRLCFKKISSNKDERTWICSRPLRTTLLLLLLFRNNSFRFCGFFWVFFFFWLLWFEAKVSFSVLEYYCRCINGRTPQFIYFKISQFGEALFYMPTCTGIILGWKNCYLLFLFLGALFFFLAVFKVEPRTQSSSSSFSCVLILNWGLPRWNSLGSPGCAVYFI